MAHTGHCIERSYDTYNYGDLFQTIWKWQNMIFFCIEEIIHNCGADISCWYFFLLVLLHLQPQLSSARMFLSLLCYCIWLHSNVQTVFAGGAHCPTGTFPK